MLNEFRTRYPQGGLISELAQIDHGKYIVRVSVQIEGTIVATGLAAADTVEVAEDRARMRALALLNLDASPAIPTPTNIEEQNSKKTETVTAQKTNSPKSKSEAKAKPPAPVKEVLAEPEPIFEPDDEPELSLEPPQTYSYTPEPQYQETPPPMEEVDNSFTLDPEEIVIPPTEPAKKAPTVVAKIEPTDYSEVIAKTNVEMKRLGWTNEQGRDYLIGTYGKRSRQLLEDEQLVEFLEYLESQPTP